MEESYGIIVEERQIEIGRSVDEREFVMADKMIASCVRDVEICEVKLYELRAIPEHERDYETTRHIQALERDIPYVMDGIARGVERRRNEYRERQLQKEARKVLSAAERWKRKALSRQHRNRMCGFRPNRNSRSRRPVRIVESRVTTKKTTAKAAADPDSSSDSSRTLGGAS